MAELIERRDSGNILFLILIAVALFAVLSYAVTRSSRGNGDISKEKATLDAGVNDQCNASVNAAVTRLTLTGGCGSSQISYEQPDGSNSNSMAPSNKSCHVFNPAGGGVSPCGLYKLGQTPCMTSLAVGESCNGVVYAGLSGGSRLYTTATDQGTSCWGNCNTNWIYAGAPSGTDGKANTDKMVSAGVSAGLACRGLGSKWYLPASSELQLLYANKAAIGGFSASAYWGSTERPTDAAYIVNFADGGVGVLNKNANLPFRCVRKD